jgi:exopolyphosphatase/guanosine-5'-triphosphate,3'-diphosphate pyrophosphatase
VSAAPPTHVAAVDLGSNSFHLLIARVLDGHVTVLDRLREPVRMAAGLDDQGNLSERALERMLAGLARFRERLVNLPPKSVRAVGTDTFRRVKQPKDLLVRASAALGVSIEVLPGGEEARLIYLGVAQEEPAIDGRRLVIDIGGGSTECILGKRTTPLLKDSLSMGCVNFTERFFDEERFTRKAFRKAEVAAALEFESLQRRYQEAGWEDCVGSSGTINAISDVVLQNGWSEGSALTLSDVKRLRREMIAAEEIDKLDLPGLARERAQVLAGGLAILKAAFETLGIENMRASKAALREGVLYDLLGRIRHEDVRDRTIRTLSERYHVDPDQAERVERTVLRCLDQVAEPWKLELESSERLLTWAARMHEIGLALSHSGHHKHGGYILENSDMPGFSRQDQLHLAALVRAHRRKLPRAPFADFAGTAEVLQRLCILLRIAVRLHRTRSPKALPRFRLRPVADGLELGFPSAWLEKHPLTRADLEEEDTLLSDCGLRLRVVPD